MAIVTNQDENQGGRVKTSDRRKRAAAARRMKSGESTGWQNLAKEDREFIANVFKEYDVNGSGTMGEEQLAPLLTALNGGEPRRRCGRCWIRRTTTRAGACPSTSSRT